MKLGPLFLNLFRCSPPLDYAALRFHLESGHLAGAVLLRLPGRAERAGRMSSSPRPEQGPPMSYSDSTHRGLDLGRPPGHPADSSPTKFR